MRLLIFYCRWKPIHIKSLKTVSPIFLFHAYFLYYFCLFFVLSLYKIRDCTFWDLRKKCLMFYMFSPIYFIHLSVHSWKITQSTNQYQISSLLFPFTKTYYCNPQWISYSRKNITSDKDWICSSISNWLFKKKLEIRSLF